MSSEWPSAGSASNGFVAGVRQQHDRRAHAPVQSAQRLDGVRVEAGAVEHDGVELPQLQHRQRGLAGVDDAGLEAERGQLTLQAVRGFGVALDDQAKVLHDSCSSKDRGRARSAAAPLPR